MSVDFGKPYTCFDNAEFFAIVSRGGFAFRFGPYTGPEIGQIMMQCEAEKIPLPVTANCGREFDWNAARDMHAISDEDLIEAADKQDREYPVTVPK